MTKCLGMVSRVKEGISAALALPLEELHLNVEPLHPFSPGPRHASTGRVEADAANQSVQLSCSDTQIAGAHGGFSINVSTPTLFPSPEGFVYSEEDIRSEIPSREDEITGVTRGRALSFPRASGQGHLPKSECSEAKAIHLPCHASRPLYMLPTTCTSQKLRAFSPSITSASHTGMVLHVLDTIIHLVNTRTSQLLLFRGAKQGIESTAASSQLAQQLLTIVSAELNAYTGSELSALCSNGVMFTKQELENKLEARLGPLAAQVLVIILSCLLGATFNDTARGQAAHCATSPVSDFLSTVCAEVQSMVEQSARSRTSRHSPRLLLTKISRTNIVKAVESKIEEVLGIGTQSQEALGQIHTGNILSESTISSVANDLVNTVLETVLLKLEKQLSMRFGKEDSALSGNDKLNIIGSATEMLAKVSLKLRPLMSETVLDESTTTSKAKPTASRYSFLDLMLQCKRSSTAMVTNDFPPTEPQRRMTSQDQLTSPSNSVEQLDNGGTMIQDTTAILKQSSNDKCPNLTSTTIYRSLLMDSAAEYQSHSTTEVLETIVMSVSRSPTPSRATSSPSEASDDESTGEALYSAGGNKENTGFGKPIEEYLVETREEDHCIKRPSLVFHTPGLDVSAEPEDNIPKCLVRQDLEVLRSRLAECEDSSVEQKRQAKQNLACDMLKNVLYSLDKDAKKESESSWSMSSTSSEAVDVANIGTQTYSDEADMDSLLYDLKIQQGSEKLLLGVEEFLQEFSNIKHLQTTMAHCNLSEPSMPTTIRKLMELIYKIAENSFEGMLTKLLGLDLFSYSSLNSIESELERGFAIKAQQETVEQLTRILANQVTAEYCGMFESMLMRQPVQEPSQRSVSPEELRKCLYQDARSQLQSDQSIANNQQTEAVCFPAASSTELKTNQLLMTRFPSNRQDNKKMKNKFMKTNCCGCWIKLQKWFSDKKVEVVRDSEEIPQEPAAAHGRQPWEPTTYEELGSGF